MENLETLVKTNSEEKGRLTSYVERTQNASNMNEQKIEEVKEKLGLFKRNFPLLFKKDPTVQEYITADRNIARAERQKMIYESKIKQLDIDLDVSIIEFLDKSDAHFKENREHLKTTNEVREVTSHYLELINDAASSVGTAQSTETLDLVTNNSAISLMSTMNTLSAGGSIDTVKEYGDSFNAAVSRFQSYLQTSKIENEDIRKADDFLDLAFDSFFDGGFDFTSFATLSQLNDAAGDLSELKEKVSDFQGRVEKLYEQYKKKQADYIDKLKKEFSV